jgi:hypothetical protein
MSNICSIEDQVELAATKAIQVIVAMKKSGLFIVLPDRKSETKERVRSLLRLLAFEDADDTSQTGGLGRFEACVDKVVGWVESNNSMLSR